MGDVDQIWPISSRFGSTSTKSGLVSTKFGVMFARSGLASTKSGLGPTPGMEGSSDRKDTQHSVKDCDGPEFYNSALESL